MADVDAGHWITVSGPEGTTHICIDQKGTITQGPAALIGQDADKALASRREAAPARHQAAAAGFLDRAKRAYALIERTLDKKTSVPVLSQLKAAAGKVKELLGKANAKIAKRYGEHAGKAIALGGLLLGANPLVMPPWFLAIPGSTFLAGLPLVAVAEAVHQGKKAGHALGLFSDASFASDPAHEVLREVWDEFLSWAKEHEATLTTALAPLADVDMPAIAPSADEANHAAEADSFLETRATFRAYQVYLREQAEALTKSLGAGEVALDDWRGKLAALLGPACYRAAIAARGSEAAMSAEAWEMAEEQATVIVEHIAEFEQRLANFSEDWADSSIAKAILYAGSPALAYEQHRRLFAREAGAKWERRIAGSNCCDACRTEAAFGWLAAGEGEPTGACACLSDCTCHYEFAAGVEMPEASPEDASFAVNPTTMAAEWHDVADLVFFSWDEAAHPRGPNGRFISLHDYVGRTYQDLKAAYASKGKGAPTQGQLWKKVHERMQHWSDERFGGILTKAVDSGFLKKGIYNRQAGAPGENFASKALAAHLTDIVAKKTNPNTYAGLPAKLGNLSPAELKYLHKELGVSVPKKASKDDLAKSLSHYVGAKAGETRAAVGATEQLAKLKEQADKPHDQIDQDVENKLGLPVSHALETMSSHELSHVATALGYGKEALAKAKSGSKYFGLTSAEVKAMHRQGATGGQILYAAMEKSYPGQAAWAMAKKIGVDHVNPAVTAITGKKQAAADAKAAAEAETAKAKADADKAKAASEKAAQEKADKEKAVAEEKAMGEKLAPVADSYKKALAEQDPAQVDKLIGQLKSLSKPEVLHLAKMLKVAPGALFYDEDQARDAHGRWTEAGGGAGGAPDDASQALGGLIEKLKAAASGETPASKAMLEKLTGLVQAKKPTTEIPDLFYQLHTLGPAEANHVAASLGALPLENSKSVNVMAIINHINAKHGDSPLANNTVAQITELAKLQTQPVDSVNYAQAKDMAASAKNSLAQMTPHELAHVAGKLGMAAGLPPEFVQNLLKSGTMPGQMVLVSKGPGKAGAEGLLKAITDKVDYSDGFLAGMKQQADAKAAEKAKAEAAVEQAKKDTLAAAQKLAADEAAKAKADAEAAKVKEAQDKVAQYQKLSVQLSPLIYEYSKQLKHNITAEDGDPIKSQGVLQKLWALPPDQAAVAATMAGLGGPKPGGNTSELIQKMADNIAAGVAAKEKFVENMTNDFKSAVGNPDQVTTLLSIFGGKAYPTWALQYMTHKVVPSLEEPFKMGKVGLLTALASNYGSGQPLQAAPPSPFTPKPAEPPPPAVPVQAPVVPSPAAPVAPPAPTPAATPVGGISVGEMVGPFKQFIKNPAAAIEAAGGLSEAKDALAVLKTKLSAMTPDQVKQLAKELKISLNFVKSGSAGAVNAIMNKASKALMAQQAGVMAKSLVPHLKAKADGVIDCLKKIYWGKPAAGCGSPKVLYNQLKGLAKHLGQNPGVYAYQELKASLGIKGKQPATDVLAIKKITDALKDKLGKDWYKSYASYGPAPAAEPAPTPTPTPPAPAAPAEPPPDVSSIVGRTYVPVGAGVGKVKQLKDISGDLANQDLHKIEPSWQKTDYSTGQHYGGVVFRADGKILVRQESHGGYAFPKGSSMGDPVSSSVSKIASKTGVTPFVVGLIPGTWTGAAGKNNYFVMQTGGAEANAKSKWVTPQEAEQLFKDTLKGVPAKLKKELEVLKAAVTAHDKMQGGGKQLPKGLATIPNSEGEVSSLKIVKSLGGSTGAKLAEDSDGQQFVLKKGNSADHIREEDAADKVYRILGANVPKSNLVDTADGPVKVAQFVENLKPISPTSGKAILDKAKSHFVADALLGNWDVVGQSFDNMMVDDQGNVWRIDNGGSMRFRAQGAKKEADDWSATVKEMESLRDPSKAKTAGQIFKGITDDEVRKQVQEILKKKDEILAAVPKDVRKTLEKRIDYLGETYNPAQEVILGSTYTDPHGGKVWPGDEAREAAGSGYKPAKKDEDNGVFDNWHDKPATTSRAGFSDGKLPADFKAYYSKVRASLAPGESQSLSSYVGSGYHGLNKAMRACPETLDCLSPTHKKYAAQLSKILAKGGKLEKPITVWRHSDLNESQGWHDFVPLMLKAMKTGKAVRLPGFKSCSVNPTTDSGFGHHNPGADDSGKHAFALEIRAKTGFYYGGGEEEFIQDHGVRYKVIGVKELKYGQGHGTLGSRTTIQLEEV